MKGFEDRLTHPLHTGWDLARMLWQRGYRRGGKRRDHVEHLPRGDRSLPRLDTGRIGVTWVGHATCVLHVTGKRFVTDPVWSKRLPGGLRRMAPPGIAWDDLDVDGVLLSHNHYDHMDAPTLKRFPRDLPIMVPLGLGRWFTRRGFQDVRELDWWQGTRIAGVPVTCVPTHHWSQRGLLDKNRSLWCGWVVGKEAPPAGPGSAGGHATRTTDGVAQARAPRTARGATHAATMGSIHFAGDSAHGHHFATIRERMGPIDVTCLPIGAYEPRWFMKNVHMCPEEAVRAAAELGARHMATMHWGTFLLTPEPLLEPLERARAAWRDAGRKEGDLWDLGLGETRSV